MIPRLFRLLLLLGALGVAPPARALFGVGDVVFDPANTAQTINLVRQAQQEFDRLGSLLGVSTRQLDQLLALAAELGDGDEAAHAATAPGRDDLRSAVAAATGLQGPDLGGLFDPNGRLDAFMGLKAADWVAAFERPIAAYRSIALASVGGGAGPAPSAAAYAQRYRASTDEDRRNLGPGAAADLSALLTAEWLGGSRQRRINFEGLAEQARWAESQIASARTLADAAKVQARLSAAANAALLEAAVQQTEAQEHAVRAAQTANDLARARQDADRNRLELELDAEP